jgi:hypothetical protein
LGGHYTPTGSTFQQQGRNTATDIFFIKSGIEITRSCYCSNKKPVAVVCNKSFFIFLLGYLALGILDSNNTYIFTE